MAIRRENKKILHGCRAFLFPGEDDFGITPVEAMSHGKPVIALRRAEQPRPWLKAITGEFFDEPVLEVMADAVRRFIEKEKEYDSQIICQQAEKFSKEKFIENINKVISEIYQRET